MLPHHHHCIRLYPRKYHAGLLSLSFYDAIFLLLSLRKQLLAFPQKWRETQTLFRGILSNTVLAFSWSESLSTNQTNRLNIWSFQSCNARTKQQFVNNIPLALFINAYNVYAFSLHNMNKPQVKLTLLPSPRLAFPLLGSLCLSAFANGAAL